MPVAAAVAAINTLHLLPGLAEQGEAEMVVVVQVAVAQTQQTELQTLVEVEVVAEPVTMEPLAGLALLLFDTPIHTPQQHQQLDRQHTRFLVAIESIHGQPLAPLRSKEKTWRTLHNSTKTTW